MRPFLQTQLAAVGAALAPLFSDAATAQRGQAGRQTAAASALLLGRGLLLVLHLLLALGGTVVLTLRWAVRLFPFVSKADGRVKAKARALRRGQITAGAGSPATFGMER